MDSKANSAAFLRAKDFFEKTYRDRGMVKWQGFYLSDHVEDVAKYTEKTAEVEARTAMPRMDEMEIDHILTHAYANHEVVRVQRIHCDELGHLTPMVQGKVTGYWENNIYIGNEMIAFDDINWCECVNA
ncbi:hypothetical protein D3P96_06700 [Weissella viridescens]|uniref:DNA-directed RNA polymerase beta subunit n=1 Tax=Weissella viridescens TaxID=1629 RepID=A0A3P2RA33_WEIVI|nr:hypothetical protein [Weissella viridescens]RRG17637.1 hypothetical protein D3P96_06700 [Weissella viridescens]